DKFTPETTDFWAMNQSMTFGLVKEKFNLQDSWEQGIPFFMNHMAKLPPGEHKVEVDLRYRLVANESNCSSWRAHELLPESECFPYKGATPISYPMARGEFVYVVPEGGSP